MGFPWWILRRWKAPPRSCATSPKKAKDTLCVMFHELSHKLGGTVDHVYGQGDALKLAQNDPAKAHKCAENYGLFALELLKQP
jgi:hypothetical protein